MIIVGSSYILIVPLLQVGGSPKIEWVCADTPASICWGLGFRG